MADRPALRAAVVTVDRVLRLIEWASMAAAGSCFIAIVAVTATDVFRRYALNAPLSWSFTLVSNYLMVAVFFLAIGSTQRAKQNVGVDMLVRRLPDRPRSALTIIALMLMLLFTSVACIAGWDVFRDAWDGGDVLAGAIAWPSWPSALLVPLGFMLLGLRLVADLLACVAALCGATDLAPHRVASHGFGLE